MVDLSIVMLVYQRVMVFNGDSYYGVYIYIMVVIMVYNLLVHYVGLLDGFAGGCWDDDMTRM